MRAQAGTFVSIALLCGQAAAAPPEKKASPPVEQPMQIHVVRSGHVGCEPQCMQWIAAQGVIVPGTAKRFRKIVRELGERKLPIFIDSGGGSMKDALELGRLIRANGLTVAVTRTVFLPCEPADAACRKARTGGELRGVAQATVSKCASACALVLSGGTRRLVGLGAVVGVHQASMIIRKYEVWTRRSFGVPVETRKTLLSSQKVAAGRGSYASVGRYLAEMGISDVVMSLILDTPSDRIRWLAPWEAQATRLATDYINGEQLATGAPTPVSFPPPPAPLGTPGVAGSASLCLTFGNACPSTFGLPSATSPLMPSPILPPAPPPADPTAEKTE
jgi:hypothetical protein